MIKKFFAGSSGRGEFAALWFSSIVIVEAVSKISETLNSLPVALFDLLVLVLGTVVMGTAAVRRARDLGHSPWFALLILVPFVGLYFAFAPGKNTPTQYELANPKDSGIFQETHQ